MKKDIISQLSFLKKGNLKAKDYAQRTIQELMPADKIKNTIIKKAVISESVIAINEGDGKFTIKNLPSRVQFSCVCGITCTDINQDGNLDLIMGGNNFEFKPQFSRLDASYGNVLLGDGNMNFEWQDYTKSGFNVKSEIKFLKKFEDKNGKIFVIAAINDEKPRIFELNN